MDNVSIIVCTHGARHDALARLVDALAWQTVAFELVVVLGPGAARSRDLIAPGEPGIRVATCDAANVSASRNAGIASATGDILVFIDDDAVPATTTWLADLVAPLSDAAVGAAGGPVVSGDTGAVEFDNGATSRGGFQRFDAAGADRPPRDGTQWIDRVAGGNCALRRQALQHVGGFDEHFAYYLDETDLCVRLVDAGFRVAYAPRAVIRHYPEASAHGAAGRRNRLPIARSDAYFVMRHAPGSRLARARLAIRHLSSKHYVAEGPALLERGEITRAGLLRFRADCVRGACAGLAAGLFERPILRGVAAGAGAEWRPFDRPRRAVVDAGFRDVTPPVDVASVTRIARECATPGLSVALITERLAGSRSGVVFWVPPPAGTRPPALAVPGSPDVAAAVRHAADWLDMLLASGVLSRAQACTWVGSPIVAALLAEGTPLPISVAGAPPATRAATPSAVDQVVAASRLGAPAGDAASARADDDVAAAHPASESLARLMLSVASRWPGGDGARALWADSHLREVVLAAIGYSLRDAAPRLALRLADAVRPPDQRPIADAVRLDYLRAHALRLQGVARAAAEAYESIRAARPRIEVPVPQLAGACFHLAVAARAEGNPRRARALLVECLEAQPDHAAARRLLDDLGPDDR